MLTSRVERSAKGHDRARAAQSNVIQPVRPEIIAAGVQSFDRANVANDPPIRVECQYPIRAAVEKSQTFLPIDGQATRIGNMAVITGNTAVITEGAERAAIEIESEKRAISVSVWRRPHW